MTNSLTQKPSLLKLYSKEGSLLAPAQTGVFHYDITTN